MPKLVTANLSNNAEPCVLRYTTSDNQMLKICEYKFDAKILSHTYNSGEGSIIFSHPITIIGWETFSGCCNLTRITIPNSVTKIGRSAFLNCNNLTHVCILDMSAWFRINFDDNLANPLNYAKRLYLNGKLVTKLIVPSEITKINNYALYNCNSIESVTIHKNITSIGDGAFLGCNSLVRVDITDIGAWCKIHFGNYANPLCCAKNLYLNNNLVTKVTIPSDINKISNYLFDGCCSLKNVSIPHGVISIGNSAFRNCCNITNISIPNSVTSIGWGAFLGCSSLINTTIPYSISEIGDYAFSKCTGELTINCNIPSAPDRHSAFCDSEFIKVTIGDSVTFIGENAFYGCHSLTSIHVSHLSTWCKICFGNAYANPLYYAKHLCINGKPLSKVVIPADITNIKSYAFYNCKCIEQIIISDNIISIENSAFHGCVNLKYITIPYSVSTIGFSVFRGCSNLTAFFGKFASSDNRCLIIEGVLHSFAPAGLAQYDIPSNISSIGDYAFAECYKLTSISISTNVKTIGNYAFYYCSNLTNITIPNSITHIGNEAFQNCGSLTNIVIPNSISHITNGAFSRCYSLTDVTICEGVALIESWAFAHCRNLVNVVIPDSVISIWPWAFHCCAKLSNKTQEKIIKIIKANN